MATWNDITTLLAIGFAVGALIELGFIIRNVRRCR
jgi:hypothetical protein